MKSKESTELTDDEYTLFIKGLAIGFFIGVILTFFVITLYLEQINI